MNTIIRVFQFGALYLEIPTMDESVSYVHSTGALICVPAIFLAFIVSYLALKSRGRANRRGMNGVDPTSVSFLCKMCRQLAKNAPSGTQDHRTKGWTCTTCSGYSHSINVSPDASGDDQSDLEIQHTLGSLAISHANAPESRASPRSWLHLIKELNLLPEQTSNENDPPHEVDDKNVADFSTSQPLSNTATTASDVEKLPRKPLIQPAKLQVRRRRRLSISSATAALSLAGSGWSVGDHVTNNTNTCLVASDTPNPFLHVPNTHRLTNNRRNSALIERRKENYFHQGERNYDGASCLASGNGLTNQRMRNNHSISVQDSHGAGLLNFSGLNLSDAHIAGGITTPHTTYNRHQQPSPSFSCLPCSTNEHHSVGAHTPACGTSINSHPHSNGIRCLVGTLVLLSVTGNIVLLVLLFMYVYKPTLTASSLSVTDFSDL